MGHSRSAGTLPARCLDCWRGGPRPCAPAGVFDPLVLADAALEHDRWFEVDPDRAEPVEWSFGCLFQLVQADPDRAFGVILHMVDRAPTKDSAVAVGSGDLEDLIATHGPAFIDRI